MNAFLDKVSSYNLFNYLLSGVLFVILADRLTPYSFLQKDIVTGIFLYYFIGLVISRLGSLIIEPLLKRFSFVHFAPYEDFLEASKNDSKIEVLSEVNNMYRTFVSVFCGLIFLKLYEFFQFKFVCIQGGNIYIILFILLVIFLFAYRKQTAYITSRIKSNTKNI
jgi:sterol desaturase/sphingolipid hydroxylase (fatty acid hydroxylase superfamily)